MCNCLGKTIFYPLNLLIVLFGLSLFVFGCYNFINTHAFNIFTISTVSLGVLLFLNSALVCYKGFKSKCLVGIYLFFLGTLLIAEAVLASLYFIPQYQKLILQQVPEKLQSEVKKHLLIARWILLGLIGAQALTFLVGLALCRGIKKNGGEREQEQRLLRQYDENNYGSDANNYTNANNSRLSDVPSSYDNDIPIASSYRAKHQHLYKKYNIQMDNN